MPLIECCILNKSIKSLWPMHIIVLKHSTIPVCKPRYVCEKQQIPMKSWAKD